MCKKRAAAVKKRQKKAPFRELFSNHLFTSVLLFSRRSSSQPHRQSTRQERRRVYRSARRPAHRWDNARRHTGGRARSARQGLSQGLRSSSAREQHDRDGKRCGGVPGRKRKVALFADDARQSLDDLIRSCAAEQIFRHAVDEDQMQDE